MWHFEADRLKFYFVKHTAAIFYLHLWKENEKILFSCRLFYLGILYCLSQQFTMHQTRAVSSFCCAHGTECVYRPKSVSAEQGHPQCLTIILYLPHCSYYKNKTLALKENNNNACSDWSEPLRGADWLIVYGLGTPLLLMGFWCPMKFNTSVF